MNLTRTVYKIAQAVGSGGTLFLGLWLLTHPYFEPNELIRWGEIVVSFIASAVLGADFLDLNPEED